MALTRFNHRVRWSEFHVVEQRPNGVEEDAEISVHSVNFRYQTGRRRHRGQECRVVSINASIAVVKAESWLVRGRQSAVLLKHEQGHYNITALGIREMYKRAEELTATNCEDINDLFEEIRRDVQPRINQANINYDRQTTHGTNAGIQQRWEASIRAAKIRPGGTVSDLPQNAEDA